MFVKTFLGKKVTKDNVTKFGLLLLAEFNHMLETENIGKITLIVIDKVYHDSTFNNFIVRKSKATTLILMKLCSWEKVRRIFCSVAYEVAILLVFFMNCSMR